MILDRRHTDVKRRNGLDHSLLFPFLLVLLRPLAWLTLACIPLPKQHSTISLSPPQPNHRPLLPLSSGARQPNYILLFDPYLGHLPLVPRAKWLPVHVEGSSTSTSEDGASGPFCGAQICGV